MTTGVQQFLATTRGHCSACGSIAKIVMESQFGTCFWFNRFKIMTVAYCDTSKLRSDLFSVLCKHNLSYCNPSAK